MTDGPPKLVALDPDDDRARYVGRTADRRQFFITTHVDTRGNDGHAFVATYLFDASGDLVDAIFDDVGTYATVDREAWGAMIERRSGELGRSVRQRIVMAPFVVRRFGLDFGIVARERDDGVWIVEVTPGNNMAFFAPWDSGRYDT